MERFGFLSLVVAYRDDRWLIGRLNSQVVREDLSVADRWHRKKCKKCVYYVAVEGYNLRQSQIYSWTEADKRENPDPRRLYH